MLTLTDLEDRTAFERFALENTTALQETDRRLKGKFDMRTNSSATDAYAGVATIGGSETLKLNLRPLMFGAAWKILDQIIEYVINAPENRHLPIPQKVEQVRTLANPPAPMGPYQVLWDTMVATYDATQELRNGLVHRRAEVAADGGLRVLNKHTQTVDVLNADEQLAMCRLSQRLVKVILADAISAREVFDISLQLTILRSYSGLIRVIGRNHREICELIDHVDVTSGGSVRIDVPALRSVASLKISGATYIDYIGWLDNTTVLCGALDEADDREYRFQLDDLPSWLHIEKRLSE